MNQKIIKLFEKHIEQAKIALDTKDDNTIYECFTELNETYKHEKSIYIIDNVKFTSCYTNTPVNYNKYHQKLRILKNKLEVYKAKIECAQNQSPILNISNNNTNTSNVNASIIQNINIENTIQKINKISDEILAKNLKCELKGMLGELEDCKDNQEKKIKLMEVVKWLCDKTADATIACLPYLAGLAL